MVATEQSVLLRLSRSSFEQHLGPMRDILDSKTKFRAVESVPIIAGLSPELKSQVVSQMEVRSYSMGEDVVTQGDPARSFFIVRSGDVDVIVDGERTGSQ